MCIKIILGIILNYYHVTFLQLCFTFEMNSLLYNICSRGTRILCHISMHGVKENITIESRFIDRRLIRMYIPITTIIHKLMYQLLDYTFLLVQLLELPLL